MAETNFVVQVPSSARNAPIRSAAAGMSRNAIAQRKNGATPSQASGKRRPGCFGAAARTASMLSAVAARSYPATSFQPSAIVCVAASLCSGVGNSTFA